MGHPHNDRPDSMLSTCCDELASMARTLHGMLDLSIRRGISLEKDAVAMRHLTGPLNSLQRRLADALDDSSEPVSTGEVEKLIHGAQMERLMNLGDPLHTFGEDKAVLRGVKMSLDEVFADGGFDTEGSRPFRRLVVEDLHDSFGVPNVLQTRPRTDIAMLSLPLHDGSPAARREQEGSEPQEPPPPPEFLLAELREGQHRGTVTMEGTNESLPVQTVFESLSASRNTGTLRLRTPRETLVFELERGDVVFAASDAPPPGDRLGDILLQLGYVNAHDLRETLSAQIDTRERLGEALERGDLVTREQLREALEEQVHRHFLRAFQAPLAAYAFSKGNSEDPDERVRLTMSRLLFESARIADEEAFDNENG